MYSSRSMESQLNRIWSNWNQSKENSKENEIFFIFYSSCSPTVFFLFLKIYIKYKNGISHLNAFIAINICMYRRWTNFITNLSERSETDSTECRFILNVPDEWMKEVKIGISDEKSSINLMCFITKFPI